MKIKINDLKKYLKEYEQKELIALVVELFKTSIEVQNFLSSKFIGEKAIEELFEQARKKVENEFFPDRGFGKLRLAEAKMAITEFKKTTKDEKRTLDLMLFYVEQGVDFTNTYGDINGSFYNSMAKMFYQVAVECDQDEELFKEFSDRLRQVVSDSGRTGWGFYEDLSDAYHMIEWVHEGDHD